MSSAGTAYCWGDNPNGGLGNGTTTQSTTPVAVTTSGVLSGVGLAQIAVNGAYTMADDFSCALSAAGAAYCWGYNVDGELGNNSNTQSTTPVAVYTGGVLSGVPLAQISAGAWHTCALDTTYQAYCWGLNSSGQLGNNSTTSSTVPVVVQRPPSWRPHRSDRHGGQRPGDHRLDRAVQPRRRHADRVHRHRGRLDRHLHLHHHERDHLYDHRADQQHDLHRHRGHHDHRR